MTNQNQILDEEFIHEDELDKLADTAIDFIQQLIPFFLIKDITIDEYEGDEGELILDITGEDVAVLIGRHGRTLDALQIVVSSVIKHKVKNYLPLVVDVEGYKNRQKNKLESIALSAANKAIKQNREIHLNPMNPYERRIIHMTLSQNDSVMTESFGEGVKRHIVVIPN